MSLIVLYFGRLSLSFFFSFCLVWLLPLCRVWLDAWSLSNFGAGERRLVSMTHPMLGRRWGTRRREHDSREQQQAARCVLTEVFTARFLLLLLACLLAAAARSNYIPAGRLATKDKGTDETERCTTTGPANQRENSASHVTTLSSTLVLSSPSMFPI